MNKPLIPERPILVSPSLAAQIGLEEATLLSVLYDLVHSIKAVPSQGNHWYELYAEQLTPALPFWNDFDIQRVSQNLRAKSILQLQSAPYGQCQQLIFAFTTIPTAQDQGQVLQALPIYTSNPPPNQPVISHNTSPQYTTGSSTIAPHWQPDSEIMARIAQSSIPEDFIREQIPEFVTFWRESGEKRRSWGSTFMKTVTRNWAKRRSQDAWENNQKETETVMDSGWTPSQDAVDIMTQQANINISFIEDAIPEFILYWSERGVKSLTWNSKFIQHVRRQWNRFTSAIEHDSDPKIIAEDWQPSNDVYDILKMANIDITFAQQLLPEFILFWRDNKQLYGSWNTKFLQHIKYHWAKRHALTTNNQGTANEGQQTASRTSRTRDRSIAEDLNDRSWAT
jgi:hypothetical protein